MLSVHTSPLDQPGTGDAGGLNVYVVEVAKRLAGRGTEVELPDLERWAETTASDLGYSDVTHTVEIFGVCADCRT